MPINNTYAVGEAIRSTATFTNLSHAMADPSTVAFKLMDAGGTVTLPSVTRASAGIYYADFVATNKPGTWAYRWEGTGTVQAAQEGTFTITPSLFP